MPNRMNAAAREAGSMKYRMNKVLGELLGRELSNHPDRGSVKRRKLKARILQRWEESGHAMRRLNKHGQMCWTLTPSFGEFLADEEREAKIIDHEE